MDKDSKKKKNRQKKILIKISIEKFVQRLTPQQDSESISVY